MPSQVHEEAHVHWNTALFFTLVQLTPPPHTALPPGCRGVGSTSTFDKTHNLSQVNFLLPAFQVGPRKKQADSAVRSDLSHLPSVVLEVGDSESLTQLKIDAKLWLEHIPEVS